MLILGAPLMFNDSASYVRGGQAGLNELLAMVFPTPSSGPGSSASSGGVNLAEQGEFIRSMPYAAFAYLGSSTPLGLAGATLLQAVFVLLVVTGLAGRAGEAPRRDIAAAALVVMLLTPLPWYASYLMPDIFAAVVVLYAAVLVSSFDRLSTIERVLLGLIATLATASHYGHVPLAVATLGAALAIRLAERRPPLGASALAAGAPIVLTLIVNVVSSAAVFDAPSAAPRRLPVLLARSIEDDPARWHLQENCAREGYTVCELFDEIPSTAWEVLWSQDGLTWRATAEQSDRIRREVILWRAFVDYPLQQSWSLVPGPQRSSAIRQHRSEQFLPGTDRVARPAPGCDPERREARRPVEWFRCVLGRDNPRRRCGACGYGSPRQARLRPRAGNHRRGACRPRRQCGDLRRALRAGRPLPGPADMDRAGAGRVLLA